MEARLYDFANPATREYFLREVMRPFMEDPACTGIIADEVTWLLHNEGWPQSGSGQHCADPQKCVIGANTLGPRGGERQAAYKAGLAQAGPAIETDVSPELRAQQAVGSEQAAFKEIHRR